jgi:hypothetical protein
LNWGKRIVVPILVLLSLLVAARVARADPEVEPVPETDAGASEGADAGAPSAPRAADTAPPLVPVDAPPEVRPLPAPPAPPAPPAEPSATLGYRKDPWQFYPMFFATVDAQAFSGRGVSSYQRADGTGLDTGVVVQHVRPGFRGLILDKFSFFTQLELGGVNSAGPQQTFAFRGGIVDAWVGYIFGKELAIQFGQMALPFGGENQRIGPTFDMLEPSHTTFIATNGLRDAGLLVQGFPGPFVYALGIFNGEGLRRAPVDSQGMAAGRLAVRIRREHPTRFQLGVSGKFGGSDPKSTFNDSPLIGLTTTQGYQFWQGNYLVNAALVPTPVTVLPAGPDRAVGVDGILQFGDFDIQIDGAYVDFGRREAARATLDGDQTLRSGALSGLVYYVTANYWLTSPTKAMRAIRWEPTTLVAPRLREPPPEVVDFHRPSVGIVARWEQLALHYDSVARSPFPTERGFLDQYATRLRVDTVHAALYAWFTTRLKLVAEYGLYYFPGDAINARRLDNQALAPGAVVQGERGTRPRSDIPSDISYGDPAFYSPPAIDARFLHEFAARVQITFP